MRISNHGISLLAGACLLAGTAGWSQQTQAPMTAPSKVSVDVAATFAVERAQVVPSQCCFWFKGGGIDAGFTFWKGLGLAAALTGDHASNVERGVDVNKISYLAGPRYTFTAWKAGAADPRRLQIFAQGLFGGAHGFDGIYPAMPAATSTANSFAIQAGGGLNLYLTKSFGIRLIEADYVRDAFPNAAANVQNDMRLSFGITYHVGAYAPPPPITLACSASPESIYPGDPVTVTATAGGLNPKYNVIYSWSGTGVTGNGTTATVATGSLAAGTYTVKCGVKEGKPGKEGLKPWETADASASFTVKAFEPPTISCSASPSIVNPGDKSTITAAGVSPQNRPLTYSYSAAAGTISGTGTTATFDSTGAAPGTVGVTCNVADDKGKTATASASVTIAAPPPPPGPSPEQVRLEARLALHSIFFPTDLPRAKDPEGGLLASQQVTLNTLAADFKSYLAIKPDAHLILTGHTDVRASVEYNQALSERRVNRAKQFLVELGVPEANIDTRAVGKEQELSADQVKDLVNQSTELSDTDKAKTLKRIGVIVLAQNRRVDITLSTTGQQSVQLYPFNAADATTLLSEKAPAAGRKPAKKKAK